jgi:predicted TIM-barrel fold metal-dependent hydrolase
MRESLTGANANYRFRIEIKGKISPAQPKKEKNMANDAGATIKPADTGEIKGDREDRFVDMVNAAVEVDLPLGCFQPRSSLKTSVHIVEKPRFPVIDYHNHLDSQNPPDLLKIMDACGVEFLVNITMKVGREALDGMDRLHKSATDRFSTIGWMDWSDVGRPDFAALSCARLERMVEHGACGIKIWKDLGLSIQDASGDRLRIDDDRLAPIFEKAAELQLPVMFHTADPDAFFEPIDSFNERYEELAAHPEWGFKNSVYSKRELLEQRNRVFARHPKTTFVGAHLAESGEDLQYLSTVLDAHPNLLIDISAIVRARSF